MNIKVELTERHKQLLILVARGLSNIDIGQQLGIKERTVKNNLTMLFGMLGASNRTHAVVIALKKRLIKLSEI